MKQRYTLEWYLASESADHVLPVSFIPSDSYNPSSSSSVGRFPDPRGEGADEDLYLDSLDNVCCGFLHRLASAAEGCFSDDNRVFEYSRLIQNHFIGFLFVRLALGPAD